MILPSRLDSALARLSAALHHLQAASEQRAQADATLVDREQEFALLQEDRNRLAAELDAALGRQTALVEAQDEVFRRLDSASRTVKDVMLGLGEHPGDGLAERLGEPRAQRAGAGR